MGRPESEGTARTHHQGIATGVRSMNAAMKPRVRQVNGEWVIATTPEQIKGWMRSHGITVTDWAAKNGFNRYTVTDLLRGKRIGDRGEAHKAAVALGLKLDPSWVRL
jgi:gp16 family phage-associated protein